MSYRDAIQEGSIVFLGPAAPLDKKTTWRVVRIDRADPTRVYATIRSGLSEQTRIAPLERLTLYRVTEKVI